MKTQTLVTLVALAGVLASRSARADGPAVTGFTGPVVRLADDGKTAAPAHSSSSIALNVVNYADCTHDLQYTFPIAVTGANNASGYTLVAYVGSADCTPYAARNGTPICWPITADGGIAQNTASPTITVRMRDLVPTPAKAAASPSYTKSGLSVCSAQSPATPEGSSLYIYFFYVDGNDNAVGIAQPYPLTVDTQGPVITSLFSVQAADESVVLKLPSTNDSSGIATWTALCDPPPGQETDADLYVAPDSSATDALVSSDAPIASDAQVSTDAQVVSDSSTDAGVATDTGAQVVFPDDLADGGEDGATDASVDATLVDAAADAGSDADLDAGTDAGPVEGGSIPVNDAEIPSVGGCSSTVFGTLLQADAGDAGQPQLDIGAYVGTYRCGQALGTDTSITLIGLENMIDYDIGLSATDNAGNSSPLIAACAVPTQSLDFFDQYGSAGGKAGGGFCETEGVGVPAGTSAFGILFSAIAAAMVRRRRRAR